MGFHEAPPITENLKSKETHEKNSHLYRYCSPLLKSLSDLILPSFWAIQSSAHNISLKGMKIKHRKLKTTPT